jgi:hypothetical protein
MVYNKVWPSLGTKDLKQANNVTTAIKKALLQESENGKLRTACSTINNALTAY